jgi:hypothetical protein
MKNGSPTLAGTDIGWALVSYYRGWLCFDGGWLKRLKGSKLIEDDIRKIGIEYQVLRGIPKETENGDKGAERLASLINAHIHSWPTPLTSLADGASWCQRVADQAATKKYRDGKLVTYRPVSAVTKLVWFLRPDGWTVYDRLASRAMGLTYQAASEKMVAFYNRLASSGFAETARDINATLKSHDILVGRGERVIDQLLVYRGSNDDGKSEYRRRLKFFLECLPDGLHAQIVATANDLSDQIGSDIVRVPTETKR